MTVYVDKIKIYQNAQGIFLKGSCHMSADTLSELHDIATKIGMKREWYQSGHYDLISSRRAEAIKLGAIECDSRKILGLVRNLNMSIPMITRDDIKGGQ